MKAFSGLFYHLSPKFVAKNMTLLMLLLKNFLSKNSGETIYSMILAPTTHLFYHTPMPVLITSLEGHPPGERDNHVTKCMVKYNIGNIGFKRLKQFFLVTCLCPKNLGLQRTNSSLKKYYFFSGSATTAKLILGFH